MTLPQGTGGVLSGLAGLARDSVLGLLRGPSLASLWDAFSGASILSDLRDMGFEIRTQTFYDLRREILGLNKWEEQIKQLGNNILLPRAWMVERSDIDFSSQAQYRFDVEYTDDNGESHTTVRSIASDIHYTKQELYDQFASIFGEGFAHSEEFIITSFDLKSVWTRPDARLIR